MKLLTPGTEIDGFLIGDCLHSGGMAHIYKVAYADPTRQAAFPMAMKVPRMTGSDGAETIVGFEVEHQMLQVLTGPHVPRFVAAGDLARLPYLVMEYIEGRTLQHWLDQAASERKRPGADEIARLGAATAAAAHSMHQQDAVHLDLKPGNVMVRPDGSAVLIDFGLSWHAHYPDLLAEEMRVAIGSPPWIAPEQVVGVRGDPRSDVFAIGVMLYELATGELPFGDPQTRGGMRQRLWMDPPPPRVLQPGIPAWLQEVILRCLEPEADQRYGSAAQLAFDLAQPGPGARGRARRAHAPHVVLGALEALDQGRRPALPAQPAAQRADRPGADRDGGRALERRERRDAVFAAARDGPLAGHPGGRAPGLRHRHRAGRHRRHRCPHERGAGPSLAARPACASGPRAWTCTPIRSRSTCSSQATWRMRWCATRKPTASP